MGNTSCIRQGADSEEMSFNNVNDSFIQCGEATKKIIKRSGSFTAVTLIDILNVIFDTDDSGVSMTEEEMWNLFDSVDTNKDGYWSKSEMVAALLVLGSLGTYTLSFATAVNCIPDESNVSFEEIKLLLKAHLVEEPPLDAREDTHEIPDSILEEALHESSTRHSMRQSSRQSVGRQSVTQSIRQSARHSAKRSSFAFQAQGPDAGLILGKMIIDLYGCENLTDAFLRVKFDAMDTKKQGYLSQGDLRAALLSSLSVSCDECGAFIESMPGSTLDFEDFQDSVSKWLKFEVADSIEKALEDGVGDVIVLDTEGLPYGFETILSALEEEAGVKGRAKYAIFQDMSTESELWKVHAIVRQGFSMKGCLQFPKSWRGLEDSGLINASGVPESASVSADGCTAVCASKESAVALAKVSVASVLNRHSFMDMKWPSEAYSSCAEPESDDESLEMDVD